MMPRLFPCLALTLALGVVLLPAAKPACAQGDAAPPAPSFAQQPAATGFPVTGRMLCADTQRPARFAQVTLIPASQDGGRRLTARTDLDGGFTLPNVPVGDYYLTGALAGYVNQGPLIQSALNAGTDPGALGAPLLRVTAGGATATLSLQRGGVFAGTVQWDDGTPAAGISVSAQPATATNSNSGAAQLSQGTRGFGAGSFLGGGFSGVQTDDRGHFRLSGLAPGSYYLRANVQAPAPQRPDDRGFARTLSLSVYAPDKVRRTDATPITVGPGEERADLSILLGLAGMHTISGTVSSSAAPVRSGSANLTDSSDSTLNRLGIINSDGTFTIPYVPPGNYTLHITASTQAPSLTRGGGTLSSLDAAAHFQPFTESITVGDSDVTGLTVTLATATASQ